MSLPPELRVLCLQLSSTSIEELPRLTPTLLRHVLRCSGPLSSPESTAGLVHKLKTRLSTLLNGKSPEGRFTAVVLIKGVIEVGGWETLRGSADWVQGLLAILGKPDPAATKELCIIALTKIYSLTHQYQTLVREITTPTLPAFVKSCLNVISHKTSSKVLEVSSSLTETIFRSFSILVPHFPNIYRPLVSQINVVARPYLAPTSFDRQFVSSSLKQSARRLVVILHHTVAKNAGGEEWGKGVRDLIKDIHVTADRVFRAVVEDWESATGYLSNPVDVNDELSGGGGTGDGLPRWDGIAAGVERLTDLLGLLEEYFKGDTSAAVSIPLDSIMDMVTRMLSITLLSDVDANSEHSGPRLHPAIDRDEKDGLWSGLPQIYVAALQLIGTMADRLHEHFISIAHRSLDQLTWIFLSGKNTPEFRLVAYQVASKLLPLVGVGMTKSDVEKLSEVIRSCCRDLEPSDLGSESTGWSSGSTSAQGEGTGRKRKSHEINGTNSNADTLLQSKIIPLDLGISDLHLAMPAKELLPLFFSCLPQQYLNVSLRVLIERTAILSHNKEAMLASILNPFVRKNGGSLATILPHLTRAFAGDDVVESLLRPRMPVISSRATQLFAEDTEETDLEDTMSPKSEKMVESHEIDNPVEAIPHDDQILQPRTESFSWGQPMESVDGTLSTERVTARIGQSLSKSPSKISEPVVTSHTGPPTNEREDVTMREESDDSDDESVHLTMQFDSDSGSEEE